MKIKKVHVFYTNRLSYWCKMLCKEPLQHRQCTKLWPDTIVIATPATPPDHDSNRPLLNQNNVLATYIRVSRPLEPICRSRDSIRPLIKIPLYYTITMSSTPP